MGIQAGAKRRGLFYSVLIALLFVLFQNCSDSKLYFPRAKLFGSFGDYKSTFPLPLSMAQEVRIVFLVDMSVSMPHGLCPNDLASDSLDQVTCQGKPGVRVGQGVDPASYRIQVMKKWINDITLSSAMPSAIKYLIVPFNGGFVESQRGDNLAFVDSVTALTILDTLKQQQDDSINYYSQLESELKPETGAVNPMGHTLGVTAPSNRLTLLRNIIQTEATSLAAQAYRSSFDIVFFSDGVPKPRSAHIKKGIRQFWGISGYGGCVDVCGTMADRYIDGFLSDSQLSCSFGFMSSNGLVMLDCFNQAPSFYSPGAGEYSGIGATGRDFFEKANLYWGDWRANTPNQIALLTNNIKKILNSYSALDARLSLVWLDPLRISPEMKVDSENWMLRIKTQKTSNRFGVLSSPDAPFSLMNQGAKLESYRVAKLFILNPYLREDDDGVAYADSDGDGLFDKDEQPAGLDNSNPRTNGRCLDSLTAQGLCAQTLTCSSNWDEDGDGLNECEEIILGTQSRDFDTDGDGLPDSLEYIYGLDPLVKENIQNPSSLVKYTVRSQGYYQQGTNSPRTEIYEVKVESLAVSPLLSSVGETLYYSQVADPLSRINFSLHSDPHNVNENPALVLVKIENELHNGDVHWGLIKYMLNGQKSQSIEVNLGLLQYLKVLDPQGENP